MPESTFFQSRADSFASNASSLNRKFQFYAGIRTAVFIAGLILLIFFANERNATAIFFSVLGSGALFSFLVKIHNKIRYQRNHAGFLAEINKDEIKRLKGDLASFDQGSEYLNDEHNYTSDLDIFGKNSLFQLINRTGTVPGRDLLASWLQAPSDKHEILDRQLAVKELAEDVDWRQSFQAVTLHPRDVKSDYSALEEWLKSPNKISVILFYRLASFLLPAVTLVTIFGSILYQWPYQIVLFSLIINGVLLGRTFRYASETTQKASKSLQSVKSFEALIKMTEARTFKSGYLLDIQQHLDDGTVKASGQIEALKRIMQKFDSRDNKLYFLIDVFFLVDIHWLIQAETWKKTNKDRIGGWISNISKLEAVSSLAGTYHTHEQFTLPEISDSLKLIIKNGGHPLIDPIERVNNDFEMEGLGTVSIITGSNMSGKSTFLRTIGINMVLGFAGGPVCCDYALLPILNVFTSMRTHDNLEEHISSFYAELRRLEKLLKLIDLSDIPVFYLLDEILKGTNSDDRHLGAESLIIQLIPLNTLGLISTHDLSLSNLDKKFQNIKNYSFNSSIEGDELHFDYTIQHGVCRGFNASKLMEKMGIRLNMNKD